MILYDASVGDIDDGFGHGAVRIIEKHPFRNSDLVDMDQFDSNPEDVPKPFP